jgi:hypothetical protein
MKKGAFGLLTLDKEILMRDYKNFIVRKKEKEELDAKRKAEGQEYLEVHSPEWWAIETKILKEKMGEEEFKKYSKEKSKSYYETHKEEKKEYYKKYNEEHKEELNKKARERYHKKKMDKSLGKGEH